MLRKITISIALLIGLFTISCWGTILTVDNNVPSAGQYATISSANNAASPGDTLYVMPSSVSYAAPYISKRLTIIGTGWTPHGYDGFFIRNTTVDFHIYFGSDSSGSILSGFRVSGYINISGASNITIDKCNCYYITITNGTSPIEGITVQNCDLIYSQGYPIRLDGSSSSRSQAFRFVNNILVSNYGDVIDNDSTYDVYLNGNCYFINNTIITSTTSGNLSQVPPYDGNAVVINNIMTCSQQNSPSWNYNIYGIEALACVSADYHTVPGSVAIDAGHPNIAFNDLDGTRNDCGAYGGPTPFVDSGIPGYPAIYEINGPGVATPNETIDIQIKAKTNRD